MGVIHLNREPRYQIQEDLVVLARPYGMKFYNFKLYALDVSLNGVLLVSRSRAFVPFQAGNKINVTFDFTSKIFERPIHMVLSIVRVGVKEDSEQFFGARVLSIDSNHIKYFKRDIQKLSRYERKIGDNDSFY